MSCSPTSRATPLRAILIGILLCASLPIGCAVASDGPRPRAGALDLTDWDFEANGNVPLEGEWEICWGAFVDPQSGACPNGPWAPFPVPRLWGEAGIDSPIGGKGIASYRLSVELPRATKTLTLRAGSPMTSYRLFINGALRGGVGEVGATRDTATPKLRNRNYPLPEGAPRVDMLVHLANFEFRGGGLRRTWTVGLDDQILESSQAELLRYAVFATMSIVIGIFYLSQFAFRPVERARGWFGAFTFVLGLRILEANTSDLRELVLYWASFDLTIRFEYATTALLVFIAAGYCAAKVPGIMPPRLTQSIQYAALAVVPVTMFAPFSTAMSTLAIIQLLPVALIVLCILSYGSAFRRGIPDTGAMALAIGVWLVGIMHDVLRTTAQVGA
jgi:hypothetical protein